MLIQLIFSFLSVGSSAAEKPVCNSDAVTRKCEYFKEKDEARITLKDGTSFRNRKYPFFPQQKSSIPGIIPGSMGGENAYGVDAELMEKYQLERVEEQAQYLQFLDSSKIALKTKLFVSSTFWRMTKSPDTEVLVPWPLQTGSEEKKVSGRDFLSELKGLVGEKTFLDLEKLNAKTSEITDQRAAKVQEEQNRRVEEFASQSKKAQEVVLARNARVQQLFDQAKKKITEILTGGKPAAMWTAAEKATVQKITDKKLSLLDPAGVLPEACGKGGDNAYNDRRGFIVLCPSLNEIPDADLLFVLGHELGHSVDSCRFQMPIWKIDQVALSAFLNENPAISMTTLEELGPMSVGGNEINMDLNFFISDEKILKKLIASGVFKKIAEGHSLASHPLFSEYQCLVQKDKFRTIEKPDIRLTKQYLQNWSSQFTNRNAVNPSIDRYMAVLKKYPECMTTIARSSQMTETLSDVMGALVREDYLLKNPPRNEDEKVGAVQHFLSSCFDPSPTEKKEFPKTLAPLTLFSAAKVPFGSHPIAERRLDRVGLNLPGMAEIYGCRREGPRCLDHLSQFRPGTSQTVEPAKSTSSGVAQ